MQTYDFAGRETVTLVTAPNVLRFYDENHTSTCRPQQSEAGLPSSPFSLVCIPLFAVASPPAPFLLTTKKVFSHDNKGLCS